MSAAVSALKVTDAMKWFTFYQTPTMVKAGVKVTGRDAYNEPLDYETERATFEKKRAEQLIEVQTQMEKNKQRGVARAESLLQEEWEEMEKNRPQQMLSPAAWSFLYNAVNIYDPQSHWKVFSKNTKFRILMESHKKEHVSAVRGGPGVLSDQKLDAFVSAIEENEHGDEPIETQPIMHMGYGILTANNARFWDFADLVKAAGACGFTVYDGDRDEALRAILEVQIELLEEIVGKNWHAEAGGRGYNPIVGILVENKRYLDFLTDKVEPKEEMEAAVHAAVNKRKKKRKARGEEEEEELSPDAASSSASATMEKKQRNQ